MSSPETVLLANIRLALGKSARHVRMFRNAAGTFWAGRVAGRTGTEVTLVHAHQVEAGLHIGASDLIGLTKIVVTPEMVGQTVAIFTSLEVKTASGKLRPEQIQWIDQVNAAGGIAGVVRSEEEALALVRAT